VLELKCQIIKIESKTLKSLDKGIRVLLELEPNLSVEQIAELNFLHKPDELITVILGEDDGRRKEIDRFPADDTSG
jgi:hypothetical protein